MLWHSVGTRIGGLRTMTLGVSLVLAFFCIGCDNDEKLGKGPPVEVETVRVEENIIAGASEARFDEQFGLDLRLPMPETELLAIAESLDLKIERRGPNETLPKPRHTRYNPDLNMDQVSHAFWLYKDRQFTDGKIEAWAAFVNYKSYVVYIESRYTFDEPAR